MTQRGREVEEQNKQVSRKYHELNPDDVEEILTPDFIARGNRAGFIWNRDQHKRGLTEHANEEWVDTIHEQVAEGDYVATRFTRSAVYKGQQGAIDFMQLKRFEGGKIAEIWEFVNWEDVPR
jgi:hypothetical protein